MSNRTVTVTYGELRLEVSCHIEPPEPEIGIRSPLIDIEEIHCPDLVGVYSRDGVLLDLSAYDDMIYDRYDKDQQFAMTLQDLVKKELEEGARAAVEDVDHYPRACGRLTCPDRFLTVNPYSAHQDSVGPLARKVG